jgi:hypothetical protein
VGQNARLSATRSKKIVTKCGTFIAKCLPLGVMFSL